MSNFELKDVWMGEHLKALHIPLDSPTTALIIGIDPGTTRLGVGLIFVDLQTLKISHSIAMTISADKLVSSTNFVAKVYGDRYARIAAIKEALIDLFRFYQPSLVSCESPFINMRRPQAFGALTEVVFAIKEAVEEYNEYRGLDLVDPPTVKKAVGAAGNAGKDDMKKQLIKLDVLNYNGQVPLDQLDEHSIDALAVAYHRYLMINKEQQ